MLRALVVVAALAVAGLTAAPANAPSSAPRAGPPPLEFAGPYGRRALAGLWTVRVGGSVRTVRIPYDANAATLSMRSFDGSVATYRTTFSLAAAGDYAIRFESVNHNATVWIDGRVVSRHVGAYLPFEARARL